MASAPDWHPVLDGAGLRAGRNAVASRLLGRDLVLWRSADGRAQAWDDRCPHRSVRLSMGQVRGDRLACAYHGWAYEAGSGRCVEIPAMPQQAVPGKVCTVRHGVHEQDGMVWVALDAPDAAAPSAALAGPAPDDGDRQWLRTLGIRAPARAVHRALAGFGLPGVAAHVHAGAVASAALRLFVQPCDPWLTLVHAWRSDRFQAGSVEAALHWLLTLRDAAESATP